MAQRCVRLSESVETEVMNAIHSDHLPDPTRKVPLSADHGISGNEPGEPRLFPIFRALWPLREDEIAQLSCTIPDTYLDFIRQANAEFLENASRVAYGSRTVGRRLVPVRRYTK